jgi:hypothetical protein
MPRACCMLHIVCCTTCCIVRSFARHLACRIARQRRCAVSRRTESARDACCVVSLRCLSRPAMISVGIWHGARAAHHRAWPVVFSCGSGHGAHAARGGRAIYRRDSCLGRRWGGRCRLGRLICTQEGAAGPHRLWPPKTCRRLLRRCVAAQVVRCMHPAEAHAARVRLSVRCRTRACTPAPLRKERAALQCC